VSDWALSHPTWRLGVRIEESWSQLGRIDDWWNGKRQKQNLPLKGDSKNRCFPEPSSSTSLANIVMPTHRQGQVCLDRAFAFIEGTPISPLASR
jgi:hypothetical protein